MGRSRDLKLLYGYPYSTVASIEVSNVWGGFSIDSSRSVMILEAIRRFIKASCRFVDSSASVCPQI